MACTAAVSSGAVYDRARRVGPRAARAPRPSSPPTRSAHGPGGAHSGSASPAARYAAAARVPLPRRPPALSRAARQTHRRARERAAAAVAALRGRCHPSSRSARRRQSRAAARSPSPPPTRSRCCPRRPPRRSRGPPFCAARARCLRGCTKRAREGGASAHRGVWHETSAQRLLYHPRRPLIRGRGPRRLVRYVRPAHQELRSEACSRAAAASGAARRRRPRLLRPEAVPCGGQRRVWRRAAGRGGRGGERTVGMGRKKGRGHHELFDRSRALSSPSRKAPFGALRWL